MQKLLAIYASFVLPLVTMAAANAEGGDLAGLTCFKFDLRPLPSKVSSTESALRMVIEKKLQAAEIQVTPSASSRLQIEVSAESSRLHIVLSVIEVVPLPNNPSVTKDVTVWTKDASCQSKHLEESTSELVDAFAIEYLKDNRVAKSDVVPNDSVGVKTTTTISAASNKESATVAGTPSANSTANISGSAYAERSADASSVTVPVVPVQTSASNTSANSNTASSEKQMPTTMSVQPAATNESSSSIPTASSAPPASSSSPAASAGNTNRAALALGAASADAIVKSSDQFAKQLSERLKAIWHKPPGTVQLVQITFRVDATGHPIDINFVNDTARDPFKSAATTALKAASPYKSLYSKDAFYVENVVFEAAFGPSALSVVPLVHESSSRIMNAGVYATNRNEFDKAISLLQLSLKYDKGFRLAKSNLAIAYNNKGLAVSKINPKLAEDCFENALALDPKNKTTMANVAGIKAIIAQKQENSDTSAALVKRIPTSDDSNVPAQPAPRSFASAALSDGWKSATLENKESAKKFVKIRFQLLKSGQLAPGIYAVVVYNSCGVDAIDRVAKELIKTCAPYNFDSSPTYNLSYDAVFSIADKTVTLFAESDPDYGRFMADLQRSIKRAWFPPKGTESKRVSVIFTLMADGSVKSLKINQSSGVPAADDAALKAVNNAKLEKLPSSAPDSVPIQFTFDYNVANKPNPASSPKSGAVSTPATSQPKP